MHCKVEVLLESLHIVWRIPF